MSFNDWYDKNKETLSQMDLEPALREAFKAGENNEKNKLLKGWLKGMRKGMGIDTDSGGGTADTAV